MKSSTPRSTVRLFLPTRNAATDPSWLRLETERQPNLDASHWNRALRKLQSGRSALAGRQRIS